MIMFCLIMWFCCALFVIGCGLGPLFVGRLFLSGLRLPNVFMHDPLAVLLGSIILIAACRVAMFLRRSARFTTIIVSYCRMSWAGQIHGLKSFVMCALSLTCVGAMLCVLEDAVAVLIFGSHQSSMTMMDVCDWFIHGITLFLIVVRLVTCRISIIKALLRSVDLLQLFENWCMIGGVFFERLQAGSAPDQIEIVLKHFELTCAVPVFRGTVIRYALISVLFFVFGASSCLLNVSVRTSPVLGSFCLLGSTPVS